MVFELLIRRVQSPPESLELSAVRSGQHGMMLRDSTSLVSSALLIKKSHAFVPTNYIIFAFAFKYKKCNLVCFSLLEFNIILCTSFFIVRVLVEI